MNKQHSAHYNELSQTLDAVHLNTKGTIWKNQIPPYIGYTALYVTIRREPKSERIPFWSISLCTVLYVKIQLLLMLYVWKRSYVNRNAHKQIHTVKEDSSAVWIVFYRDSLVLPRSADRSDSMTGIKTRASSSLHWPINTWSWDFSGVWFPCSG